MDEIHQFTKQNTPNYQSLPTMTTAGVPDLKRPAKTMKIVAIIVAVITACSLAFADKDELTQQGVDNFHALCWRELEIKPPKTETASPGTLKAELNRRFTYTYKDEFSGRTKKGSITFSYPNWDWPSDTSKGSAKQFGDKILLLEGGDDSALRALLLRIEGRWHILQLDFPGGLVELKTRTRHQRKK